MARASATDGAAAAAGMLPSIDALIATQHHMLFKHLDLDPKYMYMLIHRMVPPVSY